MIGRGYEEEDLPGPGVRAHNPALDGEPSFRKGRKEPGSLRGPGSRGPRNKSRNEVLLDKWYGFIELPTFGITKKKRVEATVFAKHVRMMREEDLEHLDNKDEVITKAMELFADDVRVGKIKVSGKSPWFVFVGRRAHYLHMAQRHTAADSGGEITRDDTWI